MILGDLRSTDVRTGGSRLCSQHVETKGSMQDCWCDQVRLSNSVNSEILHHDLTCKRISCLRISILNRQTLYSYFLVQKSGIRGSYLTQCGRGVYRKLSRYSTTKEADGVWRRSILLTRGSRVESRINFSVSSTSNMSELANPCSQHRSLSASPPGPDFLCFTLFLY